jgi:hypothetical protein
MSSGGIVGVWLERRKQANRNALPEWERWRQQVTGEAYDAWPVTVLWWLYTRYTKRGRGQRAYCLKAYEEAYRRAQVENAMSDPLREYWAGTSAQVPDPYSLRPPGRQPDIISRAKRRDA